ncbi:MAG: hypothetical protein U9N62_13360 [Thermotogota bacterium]|nr:hypothetical protein [Thermotogota bacterium]
MVESWAYKIRPYKAGANESGYSDWSPFIIYNFRAPDSLRIVHDEPSGKDFLMWDNHSKFQNGIRLLRRPKGNGFFETYKEIAGTNLEGYQLNESEKGYEYMLQGFYQEKYIEQYTADTNIVVYE